MSLDAVESARVHLALNEESCLWSAMSRKTAPRWWCACTTREAEYGPGERHCASGVRQHSGLHASKVSVVDQAGNLLTDALAQARRFLPQPVNAIRSSKHPGQNPRQRGERAGFAGWYGNYRVSVMPDLDLSTIDETQDTTATRRKSTAKRACWTATLPGGDGRARFAQQPPAGCGESMTNGTEENRSPEALSKHSETSAITLTTAASSIFSIPDLRETP